MTFVWSTLCKQFVCFVTNYFRNVTTAKTTVSVNFE